MQPGIFTELCVMIDISSSRLPLRALNLPIRPYMLAPLRAVGGILHRCRVVSTREKASGKHPLGPELAFFDRADGDQLALGSGIGLGAGERCIATAQDDRIA